MIMRVKLPRSITSLENLNEDSYVIKDILYTTEEEIPEIFKKSLGFSYKLNCNKDYLLFKNVDSKYYNLIKMCIDIIDAKVRYEKAYNELRRYKRIMKQTDKNKNENVKKEAQRIKEKM